MLLYVSHNYWKNKTILLRYYKTTNEPSAEELRCIMMKYGGSYHNYYKSGSTTHIIASNLPDCKLKLTQNHKIVKANWITDSIKANKVLNYSNYLLFSIQFNKQSSLESMLQSNCDSRKKNTSTKDAAQEGFLTDFYNNSRLHHISVMGTIFKDYVNNIRNDKNHKLTGKDELFQKSNCNPNCIVPISLRKEKKFILHIDMDCFFVSVGLRNKSELKGQPIAVTHSTGNQVKFRGVNTEYEIRAYRKKLENRSSHPSMNQDEHWSNDIDGLDSFAEIASCSYEARNAGIKNGMFVGQALKLCPDLKFIPYDFDAYKEVSYTLYNTLLRYTTDIEAVSCDELYADCTDLLTILSIDPMGFASTLRAEIKQETGCTCSVGFGGNRLLARLATKRAKPNGQFHLKKEDITSFMFSLPVSDLPGVGASTYSKLKSMGIFTCGDLQNTSVSRLQVELGKKIGETLHNYSFGLDDKPLIYNHVRKSVSADVNYGIRFQNDNERNNFLERLSDEVANRLTNIKMKGRNITLKLMVRSEDAPQETAKYLGHGICDQISKSIALPTAVSSSHIILREVLKIMNNTKVHCKDLRGIGIQVSRLESEMTAENNKLMQFLKNNKQHKTIKVKAVQIPEKPLKIVKTYEELSPAQIDQSFLNAMPEEIRKEIISNVRMSKTSAQINEIEKPHNAERNRIFEQQGKKLLVGEEWVKDQDEMKTYISPSELRLLIKQWVDMEETPHNRDISMITKYLYHLISADHLEDLLIIIKSFFRYISRCRNKTNWKQAYIKLVNEIQAYINEKYHSKLIIENMFTLT